MTKAELIEFRWKLVRAREIASRDKFIKTNLIRAFEGSGLVDNCFYPLDSRNKDVVPWDVWDFYFESKETTRKQRIAMWDNSIAHVDKLIAEAK